MGVKFSATPIFSYEMLVAQPNPGRQLWPDGTGTRPPALNFAVSPEIAVRVGSASVRMAPTRSAACRVKLGPCAPLRAPLNSVLVIAWDCNVSGLLTTAVPAKLPICQEPLMSMPSCFRIVRWISAMVTLSITWSRPRMVRELTTVPATADPAIGLAPTKPLEMSTACSASPAEATEPVSTIVSPTGTMLISLVGIAALRVRRSVFRSRPILTSRFAIWRPSPSMTTTFVWPSAAPMMKIFRVERTMAFATLGLATNTSLASRGRSTITDLPMPSSTRRDPPSVIARSRLVCDWACATAWHGARLNAASSATSGARNRAARRLRGSGIRVMLRRSFFTAATRRSARSSARYLRLSPSGRRTWPCRAGCAGTARAVRRAGQRR